MKGRNRIALAALRIGAAVSLTAMAARAYADNADTDNSNSMTEVVVTAQKRASTVQDTPESIAAISSDSLQAAGVASLATLAQGTPGVSLKSEGPSQTEIEMRGMT